MEKHFFTSGYLSSLLQASSQEIEHELRAAGHVPEMCLNEIAHWPSECLEHLRRRARCRQLAQLENFLKGNHK